MTSLALGPYDLEAKIGGGAMGELWRARHQALGRRVALKRAKSEGGVESLRREGRLLARLRSQHTLRVLDVGESQGETYLVLELLEGLDLEHLVLRHGALPPARVVHLLKQACLALGEVHRLGAVHRDVTLSNLMVCRFGIEVDVLKLVDFGIAIERDRVDQRPCGTPGYLAPEQQRGRADPRADVYALGCCAFLLLTGRPVFQARSAAELLAQHEQEPAPSPADFAEVSPELSQVVLRTLQKDPGDRYLDAHALGLELEALRGKPWRPSEARSWWDRVWPWEPASNASEDPGRECDEGPLSLR